MNSFIKVLVISCCLLESTSTFASEAKINIVSSIPALHSIILNIIDGNENIKADLLLTSNSNPHDYQLKPSDVKKINDADIIFFISENLESFIKKPYKNHSKHQIWVPIEKSISLLEPRKSGAREIKENHDDHHRHGHHHHHDKENKDYHVWLSIPKTITITNKIAEELGKLDIANSGLYKKNAKKFTDELNSQHSILTKTFSSYKNKKFMVFHDAFQYFENDYNLENIGSFSGAFNITSIKNYRELQKAVNANNASCIMYEPQSNFNNTIAKDLSLKAMSIDLISYDLNKNKDFYFKYIKNISDSFISCFK